MIRNDPSNGITSAQSKANIATFMSDTRSTRKILWPVFKNDDEWSGGTAASAGMTIDGINTDLASQYPEAWIDVQANLIALGAPGQAYQDNTRFPRSLIPGGLRYDNLHINDTSSPIVGAYHADRIAARSW